MGRWWWLWGLAWAVLAGCSTSTRGLPLHRGEPRPPSGEAVEVTYLGVGGYVVRRGPDALMFAPSITNPDLAALVLSRIETDPGKVDRCMRRVPPVLDVEWMLVGHAHYDHLLDVPYFMKRHAPLSQMLGSSTTANILAAALPGHRLTTVDHCAARNGAPGRWIYNTRRTFRVMPIESEHSPHLFGCKLLPEGQYNQPQKKLPCHALKWKEGPMYAYLVDFLQDERVVFRIHYQDAASNPELGFIPGAVLREHPVDLAILCLGASEQVKQYPERLLEQMKPRHIVLGHWEHFFGNDCDRPPEVLMTLGKARLEAFMDRVRCAAPEATLRLPVPFSRLFVPMGPPGPPMPGGTPACTECPRQGVRVKAPASPCTPPCAQ